MPKTFCLLALCSFLYACAASNPNLPQSATQPKPDVIKSEGLSALTVATWNVEHLAYPADTGCKPRNPAEISALREYASTLDADVVALQEVASLDALQQIFPATEWHLSVSERSDSEAYECRGSGNTSTQQKLAFAVRKPLTPVQVVSMPSLGLDRPGLRYGMVLTLDTATGPIDIMNVHLKSGCFVDAMSRSDKPACDTLSQQVPLLLEWMENRQRDGSGYVILGDFNHRISAPYNEFTQRLNRVSPDLTIATRDMLGCHPRYPAPIDHIVAGGLDPNWQVSAAEAALFDDMDESAMLSDHCAISATLRYQETQHSPALLWQTTSKEYPLMTRGVYAQAGQALETLKPASEHWAVVLDVDETVLDNIGYQVNLERSGQSYASDTWRDWVMSEQATLVPGAGAFIEKVIARGGKVVLITNRSKTLDAHTWRNLQALQVPVTADNTCLIGRSDGDISAIDHQTIINDKDLRRQQVSNGTADCFLPKGGNRTDFPSLSIEMQVGDNIEDFAGITQEDADIDALLPKLGTRLFLLPNPIYGSW